MKINENFLLREVAGNTIVVPVGDAAERFSGMIKINETAAFIWRALENETDEASVVDAMCAEYDIDRETAVADVARFITTLRAAGILEDNAPALADSASYITSVKDILED